ncbi:MAG: DUF4290 domain-containing protein [Flavobacteriales bacterium]|nr:DUF4290 domain-containing protein [Flavobacteriales bacterium]
MTENTDLSYNTQRPKLIIPEYGRNVQHMVEYCMSIADREERNKVANAIISVMGQLAPHLRDVEDYRHKLWTHLFVISDFKLDVDSPYPKPSPEEFHEKPNRVEYPKKNIRFGHYGKTIEMMIQKAVEFEEGEEKKALILTIANLMKRSYLTWNRDTVTDEVIFEQLKSLSSGKIELKDIELTNKAMGGGQEQRQGNFQKKKHWNKNFKHKNKKRY